MTREEAQRLAKGLSPTMVEAINWMTQHRLLETRIVNFSGWGRTMRGLKDRGLVVYEKGQDGWRLNVDGRKVARFL